MGRYAKRGAFVVQCRAKDNPDKWYNYRRFFRLRDAFAEVFAENPKIDIAGVHWTAQRLRVWNRRKGMVVYWPDESYARK